MLVNIQKANIANITKQRNLFLGMSIASIASCLLLSFKISTMEQTTVMVPSINQKMTISNIGVSRSYLEENAAMLLPLLLDLDHDSIDWKRERLFEHVSISNASYLKDLAAYFAKVKEEYKIFNLSTHFGCKSFHTDSKKMQVIASGILASHFGAEGFKKKTVHYLLSFEWVSGEGRLLLKEFRLLDEEDLKIEGIEDV
jgi:type IV conjugative transfer system protein TraE